MNSNSLENRSPKICLNMIVKNEAHIIEEGLNGLLNYISYWVISDTGSTDNTKEIIKNFFKKYNIPGELIEHKWEDFGTNRTLALEACYRHRKKFDYIWVFDADDLVIGNLEFPKNLSPDLYYLRYGKEFTYMRAQVFKSSEKWRYVGVLHEYPECVSKKKLIRENIKGDYYIDSRRLGDRNKTVDKYLKDAQVLEKALIKEPENVRYMFYLGQSYMDHRDFKNSIKWYTKRAEKGGWFEEVYYSLYKIATCMQNDGESWENVEKAYMKAWKYLSSRAEPLYEIAKHHRVERNFEKGYKYAKVGSNIKFPSDQVLFLFKSVYDYQILDELAICAFYIGKYEESMKLNKRILKENLIPSSETPRIKKNIEFSKTKIASLTKGKKEKEILIEDKREKKYKLVIGLMATLKNDKYCEQIIGCEETWIKNSENLNVPVNYFCGNIKDSFFEKQIPNIVHLENVGDEYSSATYKQYYGLRYLFENYSSDFYLIAGTDNYINVDRCLKMLEKYDPQYPFLIGGHGENRNIFGYSCHYMTGGAGLFLSNSALNQMCPNFESYIQQYKLELKDHKDKDACDVSLCHFARVENVTLVKEKDLYYCDWKGKCWGYDEFPCGGINYDKIIICHYMDKKDMYLYNYWKNFNKSYGLIFRQINMLKMHKDTSVYCMILKYYAEKSEKILEILSNSHFSTICFIKGLLDNLSTDLREITGIYYKKPDNIEEIKSCVKGMINYNIFEQENLDIISVSNLDLIFLDGLQTYENIKYTLHQFSRHLKIKGHIIIFKEKTKEIITEFLEDNTDFVLEYNYFELTILQKK